MKKKKTISILFKSLHNNWHLVSCCCCICDTPCYMCLSIKIDEVCHSAVAQLDRSTAVWSNHAIYQTGQAERCDIIACVPNEQHAASIASSPLRRAVSEVVYSSLRAESGRIGVL